MDLVTSAYLWLDAALIAPFRLVPQPILGFCLGVAVLALLCLLLGELTLGLAFLWNRNHYRQQNREMVRMHNLSLRALAAQDKASYLASNKLANEGFGKVFFAQTALFSASLWPLPFALGWLATRFTGVPMPLPVPGWELGYGIVFIVMYIVLRYGFVKVRSRLPFFGRAQAAMEESGTGESVLSLVDLGRASRDIREGRDFLGDHLVDPAGQPSPTGAGGA